MALENVDNIDVHYFLNGGGRDPDLMDRAFTMRPENYPRAFINDEMFLKIKSKAENIQFKKTTHFPVGSVSVEPGYGVVKFSMATSVIANKLLNGLKNITWFDEIGCRVSFFKSNIGGLSAVAEVTVSQAGEDWAYAKRKVRQHVTCLDPNTNWSLLVERRNKYNVKFIFLCADNDLFARLYRACKSSKSTVAQTIRLAGCIIKLGVPQKYLSEIKIEDLPAEEDSDDEIQDELFDNIDRLYEEQNAEEEL